MALTENRVLPERDLRTMDHLLRIKIMYSGKKVLKKASSTRFDSSQVAIPALRYDVRV